MTTKIPLKIKETISTAVKKDNETSKFGLETITITFGDQAENHHGMMKIGELADVGFSIEDLKLAQQNFLNKGYICELLDLNQALQDTNVTAEPAALLIVRKGADALLQDSQLTSDDMFQEQINLDWDCKAKMYGRVVNKKARRNLCYGETSQEPDYEAGKGRIVPFKDLPSTLIVRSKLEEYVGPKAKGLMAEGNYYYDVSQCGISWHGDFERRKVIAIRLGASMPLHFNWFLQSKPIGHTIQLVLSHGDLYIMSEKATGQDWKIRKKPTLRHAAGAPKYLVMDGQ